MFWHVRLACRLISFTGQHEEEYRRQLGRYGVIGDLALRPVKSLSGGQKSRVVMAVMSMIRSVMQLIKYCTDM